MRYSGSTVKSIDGEIKSKKKEAAIKHRAELALFKRIVQDMVDEIMDEMTEETEILG